jgi:hypothetical protein
MATLNISLGPLHNNTPFDNAPNGCLVTLLRSICSTGFGGNDEIRRMLTRATNTFQPRNTILIDRYSAFTEGGITVFNATVFDAPPAREMLAVVYPTKTISDTRPGSGTPAYFYRSSTEQFGSKAWSYGLYGGVVDIFGEEVSTGGWLPRGTFTAGVSAVGGYGFTTRQAKRVTFNTTNYAGTPVNVTKRRVSAQLNMNDIDNSTLEAPPKEPNQNYELRFINIQLPWSHVSEDVDGYYRFWFRDKFQRQIISVTQSSYDPPGPPQPTTINFLSGFGSRYTSIITQPGNGSMSTYSQQLTTTTIVGPVPTWNRTGTLPGTNYLTLAGNFSGNWQDYTDFFVTVSVSTNNIPIPTQPLTLIMEIYGWVPNNNILIYDAVYSGEVSLTNLSTTPKQYKLNPLSDIQYTYLGRNAVSGCTISVVSGIPANTNLIFHDIRGGY